MKIIIPFLLLTTMGRPAYAQAEFELGASFWAGKTKSAENLGSSSAGTGGWIAVERDLNRASLRLDYFGIAQFCSSCDDGDGLLLFLMLGRSVSLPGPLSMHFEGGPGYLRLGAASGFGPRVSSSLQLSIWKIGVGGEVFLARSLGADRIRPVGLGFAGRVRW